MRSGSRCEAGDDLRQRVIVGVRHSAAHALILDDARDRRVCATAAAPSQVFSCQT